MLKLNDLGHHQANRRAGKINVSWPGLQVCNLGLPAKHHDAPDGKGGCPVVQLHALQLPQQFCCGRSPMLREVSYPDESCMAGIGRRGAIRAGQKD